MAPLRRYVEAPLRAAVTISSSRPAAFAWWAERGPVVASARLERGQGLFVQPSPLAPEQPARDRLAGERMSEREDVDRLLDDEAAVHQNTQGVEEAVLAQTP